MRRQVGRARQGQANRLIRHGDLQRRAAHARVVRRRLLPPDTLDMLEEERGLAIEDYDSPVYAPFWEKAIELGLPLPAYELVLKASHAFNLLDARRAISVTERQRFILRVRTLARAVAQAYFDARAALGFPMAEEGIRKEVLDHAPGGGA